MATLTFLFPYLILGQLSNKTLFKFIISIKRAQNFNRGIVKHIWTILVGINNYSECACMRSETTFICRPQLSHWNWMMGIEVNIFNVSFSIIKCVQYKLIDEDNWPQLFSTMCPNSMTA